MPAVSKAARTARRSPGAVVMVKPSSPASTSSAPASRATSMTRSSSTSSPRRTSWPRRLKREGAGPAHHGRPAGGVRLVGGQLKALATELAGAPLDGPVDGVVGHRVVLGLLD